MHIKRTVAFQLQQWLCDRVTLLRYSTLPTLLNFERQSYVYQDQKRRRNIGAWGRGRAVKESYLVREIACANCQATTFRGSKRRNTHSNTDHKIATNTSNESILFSAY
jgi:hypothetical protein